MKKIYIQPESILVHVQIENIIALSKRDGDAKKDGDDNGVTMGTKSSDSWNVWSSDDE